MAPPFVALQSRPAGIGIYILVGGVLAGVLAGGIVLGAKARAQIREPPVGQAPPNTEVQAVHVGRGEASITPVVQACAMPVVDGGAVPIATAWAISDTVAAEPDGSMPIGTAVDILKKELGLKGNMQDVVQQAAFELHVDTSLPLVEMARQCVQKMGLQ